MQILKNVILLSLILISIIYTVIDPYETLKTVNATLELWSFKVLPTLFPFFILVSLSIRFGYADILSEILNPLSKLIFRNKDKTSSFVFFTSLATGNPSGAKMISELLDEGKLSKSEANRLLTYTAYVNPLFIYSVIGYGFFKNLSITYILLISHISANILIGFFTSFRRKTKLNLPSTRNIIRSLRRKQSVPNTLIKVINDNINIMFMIAGFMIFFNLFANILLDYHIIDSIAYILNPLTKFLFTTEELKLLLVGSLEMVSGVNRVFMYNLPIENAVFLISIILSFAGFSIHMQVYSLISSHRLKYSWFLIARVIQAILSGIITKLIFPYIYKSSTYKVSTINLLNNINSNLLIVIMIILGGFCMAYINKKEKLV